MKISVFCSGRGDDEEALFSNPSDGNVCFDSSSFVEPLSVRDRSNWNRKVIGRNAVKDRLSVTTLQ